MGDRHLNDMLGCHLLWVGGKGGVGKTSVAAALGILAARQGKETLVVSTDPAHSLGDAFARDLGDRPRRVLPGLDALELDPDREVDAHLEQVLGQMRRYASADMMPELERQVRLTRQSPGTQEAALLERIAGLVTDAAANYDLVIFDTAPTGHTLRLLSLPEAMAAWTNGLLRHNRKSRELGQVLDHLTPGAQPDSKSGSDDRRGEEIADKLLARRRLFMRARRILTDPEQSNFLFVLTPERLPLLETRRAVEALAEVKVPVAGAIINRVLPAGDIGSFLEARRRQEASYLEEIEKTLAGLFRTRLPLMDSDINGVEGLEKLADLLDQAEFHGPRG